MGDTLCKRYPAQRSHVVGTIDLEGVDANQVSVRSCAVTVSLTLTVIAN